MKWLRMYYEARTDAKLRVLSDRQHRVWFNLLCFAAEHDPQNASVTVKSEELLAVEVADGDVESLRETIQRLAALDILTIDGDQLRFSHFRERQYDYPSDEPEAVNLRVKRHRNAKKRDTNDVKRDVTTRNDTEEKRTDPESDLPREPHGSLAANAASAPTSASASNTTERPKRDLTREQAMFGSLIQELGYAPDGDGERGKWNRAIKALISAEKTASDIPKLVERFGEICAGAVCTPLALANNIGMLSAPRDARVNGTAFRPKKPPNGARPVDRSSLSQMSETDVDEFIARMAANGKEAGSESDRLRCAPGAGGAGGADAGVGRENARSPPA